LALDDSLALGLAFNHVFNSSIRPEHSIENINKILSLYSKTRQPHTARLLRIVHSQIEQRASAATSLEEEDAALVARMRKRPNTEWLSEHDVEAAFRAVVNESEAEDHFAQTSSLGGKGKANSPIEGAIQFQKSKI
jgi:salicylate hydroxylase